VTEWFGSRNRIGMVHFRNCVTLTPAQHFVETFIDDGACDMLGCMQALQHHGYSGGLDPDHTPRLLGDGADTTIGWTLALGYMAALRDVVGGAGKRAERRQASIARHKL
jgi:mannonate dehydratase